MLNAKVIYVAYSCASKKLKNNAQSFICFSHQLFNATDVCTKCNHRLCF